MQSLSVYRARIRAVEVMARRIFHADWFQGATVGPRCVLDSLLIFAWAICLPASVLAQDQAKEKVGVDRRLFLQQHCLDCHNQDERAGGLSLEGVSTEHVSARPEVWENVARRLTTGEMPPAEVPRPNQATIRAFTARLISELDVAAERTPYAGRLVIRRLNRSMIQYSRTPIPRYSSRLML